jgi:hypothetical protein
MTAADSTRYDRIVAAVRDAVRRVAVGLAVLALFLQPAVASAASGSFAIGDRSVVQVYAGNLSQVTIRAWDRPTLQIDTDDEAVQVMRRPLTFGTVHNPLTLPIPVVTFNTRDPLTGAMTPASLPPEDFPYASDFRAGSHDNIRIVTAARSRVSVMVPSSTALLDARIRGAGILTIEGYHGGTLFASNGGGRTELTDVTSSAFVQMINGRLDVRDSSFDRLRARANTAALAFERTRARQIEVTTISGPIVYDDGTFDPGLARFESASGSIAIGVAAGAQIQARSAEGRVLKLWERRTPTDQRNDGEASAIVDGGGPVVNAVSGSGNVFLYDGSLETRRVVPQAWRAIQRTIRGRPALGRNERQPNEHQPSAFDRFRALRGGR